MPETAATALPISEEAVVSRNPGLMTAAVHDETMMMDIEGGKYYGLDDIGSAIWQRLEAPQTFAALIDGLAAEYDAERNVIAADVARLLALMAEHKVINLAQGS
ncbi:MAG: PqqD family protein [Rhizomicrobium sp.]